MALPEDRAREVPSKHAGDPQSNKLQGLKTPIPIYVISSLTVDRLETGEKRANRLTVKPE